MRSPFRYFNSSPEVIRLVVMMYVRYPLSLRNVEDLLAERGIDISHETIRFWWNRFGPMFAAEIRKNRVARLRRFPQWRWHDKARGNGFIADTQKSDETARRQATRDRSLRGKDCADAPTSPPLRAIFPLELFASRQFDLVQAILRPSRPQSALPSCLAPERMEAAGR